VRCTAHQPDGTYPEGVGFDGIGPHEEVTRLLPDVAPDVQIEDCKVLP
jgi:hypothetical protein